ncbi:acylphosphatase [Candidatus Parcubacteria bacterium]|nr:MAG: acylphosphatase [Candidatus Parcubacteria bacterium]
MEEILCRVHGRVQMVMYRDFVQRKARSLALVGYVRNMPDFTVEVVAQGHKDSLEKLAAHLHKGPFLAHVTKVDIEWHEPKNQYQSFDIVF